MVAMLTEPPEVRQLFAAATPDVLDRLRKVDYRIPLWGSLVVHPRTRDGGPYIWHIGEIPEEKEKLDLDVRRASFLAQGVFRALRDVEPHELPHIHAPRVGSVLTPKHVLTFHSPHTDDEANHVVALWFAFEGGMLSWKDVDRLARGINNPTLKSALRAFSVECAA